ncbi:MAG: DUF2207 domain-containing protein, partial [Desulfovibrio sp.]|nr:DUF2207 domain-containing protein [Desulfovibrio sp.]
AGSAGLHEGLQGGDLMSNREWCMKRCFPWRRAAGFLAAVLLCLLCQAQGASAQEAIESFVSEIAVQADASLLVTETMQVSAEGEAVKHGIFRAVPSLSWHGRRLRRFGVELVEARMDGEPVPCRTDRKDVMTTFIVGDPDKELAKGEHEVVLVYRLTGHVRRNGDGFSLRLDATGNQWSLPIEEAAAVLNLPDGTELEASSGFLAKGGSREACGQPAPLTFAAEGRLESGESLVVEASWRGGGMTLPAPSLRERLAAFGPQLLAVAGLAPLLCLVLLWICHARLRKPPVVPLFAPPEGLSPGLAAHVAGMEGSAGRADLLWTAVRGFARLAGAASDLRIFPAWPKRRPGGWQDEACFAIADGLFADRTPGGALRLDAGMPGDWRPAGPDEGDRIARVLAGLQSGCRAQMKAFYAPAWPLALAGFAVNAALLYGAMYAGGWPGIYDGENLNDFFLWIVLVFGLAGLWPLMKLRGGHGVLKTAAATFFSLLALLALGWTTQWEWPWWAASASCTFAPLLFWLRCPRWPRARGLAAEAAVKGLAMYIGAAEKDRLALAGAPGDTPEQYGQMLPYAAALGMAEAWAKRFARVPGCAGGLAGDMPGESVSGTGDEVPPAGGGYEAALEAAAAIAAAYGASQRDGGDFGFDGDSSSSGGDGGGSSSGGGGGW